MEEIEIEKSYLAKSLPENIQSLPVKEIIDIYFPVSSPHPSLRLRKNGEKYEITKKEPIDEIDTSSSTEKTVALTKEEFEDVAKAGGKVLRKLRYIYDYEALKGEIDVFQDALEGLVLVEFEFPTEEAMRAFNMPPFCLADVTDEKSIAGGYLAGKSYQDIEEKLNSFHYVPLHL